MYSSFPVFVIPTWLLRNRMLTDTGGVVGFLQLEQKHLEVVLQVAFVSTEQTPASTGMYAQVRGSVSARDNRASPAKKQNNTTRQKLSCLARSPLRCCKLLLLFYQCLGA